MRLISLILVTCPSTWPLLMARVKPAWTADLSRSTPSAKLSSVGKSALVNPTQPGIQALSFELAHHDKKVLNELVGRIQSWGCPTERGQMLSFDLLQCLCTTHEQRDRSGRTVVR